MHDNFLTAGQAAEILNIHRETLRRYEAKGLIQAQKTPGGHRRYSETDVLEFKNKLTESLKQASKQKFSFPADKQEIDPDTLREYSRISDLDSKLLENMNSQTAANILTDFFGFKVDVKEITVKVKDKDASTQVYNNKRWNYCLTDKFTELKIGELSVNPKGEIFLQAENIGQLTFEHQLQTVEDLEAAIVNLATRKVSKLICLFRLGILAGLSLILADFWWMFATGANGAQWIGTATLTMLIGVVLWGMKICLNGFHKGLVFQKIFHQKYTIEKQAIFNDQNQRFQFFISV